jgi:hypothetical protein
MKLPPLSYTHLSAFMTCPHKYYRGYVLKDLPRGEPSEAMAEGIAGHKAFEERLGKGKALPPQFAAGEAPCQNLEYYLQPDWGKGTPRMRVEYFLGILPDGQSCQWDNKNCWFRGKSDVVLWNDEGAWFVDWKFGKVPMRWEQGRPLGEDPFELECQAMLQHAHHPVATYVGEYFQPKEGRPGVRHTLDPVATRQRVQDLDNKMRAMNEQGKWPKTPGPLCGWCDVRDCEHRRERTCAGKNRS